MDLVRGARIGEKFAINFHARRSHGVNHVHLGLIPPPHQNVTLQIIQTDARFTRGIKRLFDPSFARGPHQGSGEKNSHEQRAGLAWPTSSLR